MSLAGYFPPLCEESEGEYGLLLDGGYMNNLPIDTMQSLYPSTSIIIAIDVSNELNLASKTYGDSVSGWWIILRRAFYLPLNTASWMWDKWRCRNDGLVTMVQGIKHPHKVHPIPTCLCHKYGTDFLSGTLHPKRRMQCHPINETSGVIYLRPPVADVGTLEFGRFEEVLERGLLYGRQQVEKWKEDGTITRLS